MSLLEYNIQTRTIKGPIDDVIHFVHYICESKERPLSTKLTSIEYNFKNRTIQGPIEEVIQFVNYIHCP